MRYSLRNLWPIASAATEKPTVIVWEPALQHMNWLGRAAGWDTDYKGFRVELNPVALTDWQNRPTPAFADVLWHELWHVRQGHCGLFYEPMADIIKRASIGHVRTTGDGGNVKGNRYEAQADMFAAMAAERWPTSWLLRQMLIRD